MNEVIYQARRDLFDTMNVPVTKADIRILKWKQCLRLAAWEGMLKSLLVFKRILDVVLSLAALILLIPLFLAVSILIILTDGRPVIYLQKRVGLYGQEFRFYKFRSMYRDADELKEQLMAQNESGDGVIFKMKRDPRVMDIGRFIRRFSIDETPQFFNVLIGDLSIVGPRPPLPSEVAEYSLSDRKRLHVKPGLPCPWQIQGRSEIPFEQQVGLDMQYIHSHSILQDVIIMFKTIPAVLFGRGAY